MKNAVRVSGETPLLRWAGACLPLAGETISGDLPVVCPFEGGVLLGAVDALGHGPEAAFAANVAVEAMKRHASEPLVPLFRRCHEILAKTRGVVAGVGSLNLEGAELTWVGVGNIEGQLLRADPALHRESMMQYGGVVGYKLPQIASIAQVRLLRGDRLIFTSDGIKDGFAEHLPRGAPLPEVTELVLSRFVKGTDDALVLVAEYVGAAP